MIRTYSRKKGKNWQVQYYDPTRYPKRIERSLGTSNKRHADAELLRINDELSAEWDPWTEPRAGMGHSASAQAEKYCAQKGRKTRTIETRRKILSLFLRTLPSGMGMDEISHHTINRFLRNRSEGYYVNLRTVINAWMRHEGLAEVMKQVPRKTRPKVHREELRPSEIERIKSACLIRRPDLWQMPYIIDLFASTGMRRDEMCRLRMEDIFLHLDDPRIRIAWGEKSKGKIGKTVSSTRIVPVFNRAIAAIRALSEGREQGFLVDMKYDTLGKRLRQVCEAAYPGRGVRAHWFRHTFITWCMNDLQIPAKITASLSGHSDEKTLYGYVRVTGRTTDDAIRRAQGKPMRHPPAEVANWLAMEEVYAVRSAAQIER